MIGTDQENGKLPCILTTGLLYMTNTHRSRICVQLSCMWHTIVRMFAPAHGSTLTSSSPGAMALAATGSVDIADKVTAASAMEMKVAGINWVYVASLSWTNTFAHFFPRYSPVADVNSDPRNPVIGEYTHTLCYSAD